MPYQLLETSFADLDRLYKYHVDGVYGAAFGIKGFDYPWLLTSFDWKPEIKVLDVGPAYSPMPLYLQEKYGCEVWAVDDFGMTVDDEFWQRGNSPKEFISQHPEINYVLERLGNPGTSTLPPNHFDVVYSLSVLEHVPTNIMPAVWRHMDTLLKPGGEMLHAVDLLFPSNGGVRKLAFSVMFDWFHRIVPAGYKQNHVQATPLNYLRQVSKLLGIKMGSTKGLDVLTMSLSPNTLVENYQYGLNRITKDKMKNFHFQRFGSLMIRLRKLA
jgi:2-polyprenyl-3-methyl-5-hydroxy-6-metoxy-1,4-benzoquinol methylase